ncbi:MAG: flagellar protein FliS [Desulfovibrionaceae bacterium]
MNIDHAVENEEKRDYNGIIMFLEIFDAVERAINKAKKAIEEGDVIEQNRLLMLCTEIVCELEEAMLHNSNEEESTVIIKLLTYVKNNITEGNINSDIQSLDSAYNVITQMHTVAKGYGNKEIDVTRDESGSMQGVSSSDNLLQ